MGLLKYLIAATFLFAFSLRTAAAQDEIHRNWPPSGISSSTAKKSVVGSDLPTSSITVASTLKNSLYFFAILFIGISLYKKFRPKHHTESNGTIEVITKHSFSPRSALLLVRVADQTLLLSQSGDNVSMVTQIDFDQELEETELESEFDNDYANYKKQSRDIAHG